MATDGNENDGEGKKLNPTEMAIIEMMKKQNLQAQQMRQLGQQEQLELTDGLGDKKKHAFWDTQVCTIY
jgi:hypothetical protein